MHIATAAYQTPHVFGTQAVMIPAYMCCIVFRLYTTIDLILNPLCAMKVLRAYSVLSVYTWCRVFIFIFTQLKILDENMYTVSITLAGLCCLPSVGPGANILCCLFTSRKTIILVIKQKVSKAAQKKSGTKPQIQRRVF